jgi:hypothetical protein
MNRPPIPEADLPVLLNPVQVEVAIRPARMPWQMDSSVDRLDQSSTNFDHLSDLVLERVQLQLAQVMPEMLRQAIDQILKEQGYIKTNS